MNLAQLTAAFGGDNDEGPGLTDEQQITRLQEYFAQVYAVEPERFEPGQVIWHKNPELADIRTAGQPSIFVGYLGEVIDPSRGITEPDEFYGNAATGTLDATMLVLRHDDSAGRYFIDTRFYTATKPRSA